MLAATLVGLLLAPAAREPSETERIAAAVEAVREAFRLFDLDPRIQGQLLALTALPDGDRLGTAELEYNQSMWSVGTALAVGYEHLPAPGGTLDGGFVRLALQWRFLALAHRTLYRWLDPHLDLGVLLGGASNGDDAWFRVSGYLGAGLDLRFLETRRHAVLTVRYRFCPDPLQLPHGLPEHLLVLGFGVRVAM